MKEYIYYFEILAAVTATITYKWYRNSPSRYFLYYLWFVVIIETLGHIPKLYFSDYDGVLISNLKIFIPESLLKDNIWLINIYDLVTYNFYLFYFTRLIEETRKRKLVFLLFIPLWIVIITTIYIDGDQFNTLYFNNIIICGSLLILLCTFIYFYEVFNSDRILEFHKTLPFWIITGTLIFQLGVTPITIFLKQLGFSHAAYNVILSLCNYILYGSFVIGFIINARQQKLLKSGYNS